MERVDKPELPDCLQALKALRHTRYLLIALSDDLAKQQQEPDTRKRNLMPALVIYEMLYYKFACSFSSWRDDM